MVLKDSNSTGVEAGPFCGQNSVHFAERKGGSWLDAVNWYDCDLPCSCGAKRRDWLRDSSVTPSIRPRALCDRYSH
jgi:hypothetical protein